MRVPWSSVFARPRWAAVLKAVYVAFLKGKVVNLPGGIGPITLPSEGHTIPRPLFLTTKPLPAGMELPRDEKRRAPLPPRADGLPEPVDPPVPLSVTTLGWILFVVFGLPIVALTILGVLEWRTLADDTPGNHITATMRAAFNRSPGAVFLATLVWVGFLVAVGMGLAAHFWFQ